MERLKRIENFVSGRIKINKVVFISFLLALLITPINLVLAETTFLGISPDGKGWLEEIDGQLVVYVSGTAYERGFQHGYLLNKFVKYILDGYLYNGNDANGNPGTKVKVMRDRMSSYIKQRYIDEIRGIHDGVNAYTGAATVHLIDLECLSVQPDAESIFGCEQFAVWGNAAANNKFYHGRNLKIPLLFGRDNDTGLQSADLSVVIIEKPSDINLNNYALFGFPGFPGCVTGMSSEGISCALNYAGSMEQASGYSDCTPFIWKQILEEAKDIHEGVDILKNANKPCARITVLSDSQIPEAYAIEITSAQVYAGAWNNPDEAKKGISRDLYQIEHCVRRMNALFGSGIYQTQSDTAGNWTGWSDPDDKYLISSKFVQDWFGKIDLRLMKTLMADKCGGLDPLSKDAWHSTICMGDTLDFWIANAVGGQIAQKGKFYHYNLSQLLSSMPPSKNDMVMPKAAITYPAPASNVSGEIITISGTASDNIGIEKVLVMIDDTEYIQASGLTNWNIQFNTSRWRKGWHRIKVKALDTSGNGAIDMIGLNMTQNVDNIKPDNWSNFSASNTEGLTPDCTIKISDDNSGLNTNYPHFRFSTDEGNTWSDWIIAESTGVNASTEPEIILAGSVPFNQSSQTLNKIQFKIEDMCGNESTSPEYTVGMPQTFAGDSTPPASVAVRDGTGDTDIDSTPHVAQLSANWDASSDAESAIAKYWYKITTIVHSAQFAVVDWTDNGLNTNVTHTGLTLTTGTKYYFTVQAENGAGLMSSPASSDGQTVCPEGTCTDFGQTVAYPNPYEIRKGIDLKFNKLPDGTRLSLYSLSGELVFTSDESNTGEIRWDGKNTNGSYIARGIYIYCLKDANGNKKTGKIAVK